ncbi:SDH family Clp fold serine proteinase [Nitrosomonas communis]|uniref:Serine dehydrogenase proteinase n=1 Tax=Nitrosomonas communis TaxID=44574 RepID=A0A1I4RV62_9PROT|nr:hypothetical protein [Nitrosomonas communis]SFM56071.1 Serine dehydrogenase proteinase [Nitrosomonas communis]
MNNTELTEQEINNIAKSVSSDLMLISGDIDYDTQEAVLKTLKSRKNKHENLIFILATPGGFPDCAYRMSREIQHKYKKSTALIAGWCKSAGTLCVIGASELVMADEAELGPLDVQLLRRDELGELDSGLVISEALNNLEYHAFSLFESFFLKIKEKSKGSVTFKTSTEIAASITKGLFEELYKQIDPQKIGEVARSLAIAKAYGVRLNLWAKNMKDHALDNLTLGYPSHGFVIDRREASGLFHRVRSPSNDESRIIEIIGDMAIEPARSTTVFYLNAEENIHETPNDKERSKEVEEIKQSNGRPVKAAK